MSFAISCHTESGLLIGKVNGGTWDIFSGPRPQATLSALLISCSCGYRRLQWFQLKPLLKEWAPLINDDQYREELELWTICVGF